MVHREINGLGCNSTRHLSGVVRTWAIPERLRGVFMTRRYTNPCLPYLTLPYLSGLTHRQDYGQARSGSWQGITKQDWQVCQASQHPHLLLVCCWDSGIVAWHGHRADTRDRQTYHQNHTTFLFECLSMALQRGNEISFQNTIITKWSAVTAKDGRIMRLYAYIILCIIGQILHNRTSSA